MKDYQFDIENIKVFFTTEKSYRKKTLKKTDDPNMTRYTSAANKNVDAYKDIVVNKDGETLLMYSQLRGITVVLTDILFRLENDAVSANKDWHYVLDLINKTDKKYDIQNSGDAKPDVYILLLSKIYGEISNDEYLKERILQKREAKHRAKKSVKYKYKIGDMYSIRRKNICGENIISDEVFEVKKNIYSIGTTIINSVVMKQVYGRPYHKKTLSSVDCRTYHLKFEQNLFLFSMNNSFYKLTEDDIQLLNEKINVEKEIEKLPEVENKVDFTENTVNENFSTQQLNILDSLSAADKFERERLFKDLQDLYSRQRQLFQIMGKDTTEIEFEWERKKAEYEQQFGDISSLITC